jgi:hypothetical protein
MSTQLPASTGMVILGCSIALALAWVWIVHTRRVRELRRFATLAQGLDASIQPPDRRVVEFRFGRSMLLTMGHCWRLSEMLFARRRRAPFWLFRIDVELAHGLLRQERGYFVLWIDMPPLDSRFLLWHDSDVAQAPLGVRESRRRCGDWRLRGEETWAQPVAAWLENLPKPAHSELLEGALWVYWPAGKGLPAQGPEGFETIGDRVDALIEQLSKEKGFVHKK